MKQYFLDLQELKPKDKKNLKNLSKGLDSVNLLNLTTVPQSLLEKKSDIIYLHKEKASQLAFWSDFFTIDIETLYPKNVAFYVHALNAPLYFGNISTDTIFLQTYFLNKASEDVRYVDTILLHELSHRYGEQVAQKNDRLKVAQSVFGKVWNCLEKNSTNTIGTDESFADWLAMDVLMYSLKDKSDEEIKEHLKVSLKPFCDFIVETKLNLNSGVHPPSIYRIEEIFGAHPKAVKAFNVTEGKLFCEI